MQHELAFTPTGMAIASDGLCVQLVLDIYELRDRGGRLQLTFGNSELVDGLIGALLDHRRRVWGKTENQKKMLSLLRHAEFACMRGSTVDVQNILKEAREMLT